MSNANHYVKDRRNSNVQGPFTKTDASLLAADLNDFVRRNAGITTNPFYVKATK